MVYEPLVLTINRDDERALKFAEEVVERCPEVRVSKATDFGPPELCHGIGRYIWPEGKIRQFLNKRFNLEPPM